MTTDVINGVPRELLEELRDSAYAEAQAYHQSMAGYREHEHARLDEIVRRTDALLATAQPAADGERGAFEAGINPHCRKRNEHGDYVVPEIQDRWDGWQARAAQPAKAEGVAVPAVSEIECRKMLFAFGLECNAIGLMGAAENLHKTMKEAAKRAAAPVPPVE
jgi:hypothetical protein